MPHTSSPATTGALEQLHRGERDALRERHRIEHAKLRQRLDADEERSRVPGTRLNEEDLRQRTRQRVDAHGELEERQQRDYREMRGKHLQEMADARAGHPVSQPGATASPDRDAGVIESLIGPRSVHDDQHARLYELSAAERRRLEEQQTNERSAASRYDHPRSQEAMERGHTDQHRRLAERHHQEADAAETRRERDEQIEQRAQERQAKERQARDERHAQELAKK